MPEKVLTEQKLIVNIFDKVKEIYIFLDYLDGGVAQW